ncbi:MAG: hypothetical protein ACYCWE_09655 [Eubacteriales bacterium]
MANTINYAQIFNTMLDEIFYILSTTLWMENTTPGIKWDNGRYVNIPKLQAPKLGNMAAFKAPDGDLAYEYEQKYLQYYRGRNMSIGRYDVNETNFALTVGNALKVFLNENVIPEMDMLRIMKAAQAAYKAAKVSYYAPAVGTVLTNLLSDIATVQDAIGEREQLYIQISTTVKNMLMLSTEITRYLNSRELSANSLNLKIQTVNDQFLIGTPSSYLKTSFYLLDGSTSGQTDGGLAADPLAQSFNWLIASRTAIDAISRPQITKIIDPDTNQEGEYWKIMFSVYHGVFDYDNKVKGLRLSVNSSAINTLYVASADVEAAGKTGITCSASSGGAAYTVPDGYKLYYKTHASVAPAIAQGTAIDATWTECTSAFDLTATNGHKISVALVKTGSLLPVAGGNATIAVS